MMDWEPNAEAKFRARNKMCGPDWLVPDQQAEWESRGSRVTNLGTALP